MLKNPFIEVTPTWSYTGEAFTFNQRGRMSSATSSSGTTNYVYNALGQLIEKSGNGGTAILAYDEAGHLLGEYSSSGALIQETIWMDDLPVATLRPNGTTGCASTLCIFYVHPDHLGAPRKVTASTSANTLMWRWDPDTFGSSTSTPNQTISGLGTFGYNLRFPGQYALLESGLSYNYFRTYDPQTGRYLESDPLGLTGGINPYAYAQENPLSFADPTGLFSLDFNVTEQSSFSIPGGNSGFTVGRVTHLRCSCSPTCDKKWKLDSCSGTLQVDVYLQTLQLDIYKVLARRAEQQHVDDWGAARNAIEATVTSKENSLKGNLYGDEKTCADAAQASIKSLLYDLIQKYQTLSYNKYDYPGGPHGH